MDKVLDSILRKVSKEYGITFDETNKVHKSPYKFTKKTISEIDFNDMTEEEFNNTRKSFSFIKLFRLYPRYSTLKHIQINNKKKKDGEI